jgi:hypothetical protein
MSRRCNSWQHLRLNPAHLTRNPCPVVPHHSLNPHPTATTSVFSVPRFYGTTTRALAQSSIKASCSSPNTGSLLYKSHIRRTSHALSVLHTYAHSDAALLRTSGSRLTRPRTITRAIMTTQVRHHAGHGHHHHHDNTYLTSTNKNDAGVRITRIGLFVNLGMAIGKGVGGYVFHSQGIQLQNCASRYLLTGI